MIENSAQAATPSRLLNAADNDPDTFFDFFTEDCVFRMGNNDEVHGRDNIVAWVSHYARSVTEMRHVILEQWSDGDVAAVRVEVTYRMNNGDSFTIPGVTRFRVKGDRIVEYLIFMDPSPVVAASD